MGSDTAPLRRGRNTGDDGHFHPMQIDRNSSSASDGRLDLWSGELMRCKEVIKWDSVASQGGEVCAQDTHTRLVLNVKYIPTEAMLAGRRDPYRTRPRSQYG